VEKAEQREKLNIERQKEFGISQTRVETERHKNIMVELQFMKDNNITMLNRSSYPFYPRYDKSKFKKHQKGIDGDKKNGKGNKPVETGKGIDQGQRGVS
jgi:hypothetical protein